ncbi:unnamed protein product [Caenorhabditis nigoni]
MILLFSFFLALIFGGPAFAENSTITPQNGTEIDYGPDPMELEIRQDPRCLPGCFFETNILGSWWLEDFPQNCTTVCAPYGFRIDGQTDLSEKQLTEILKNMKNVIAFQFAVTHTRFKNTHFLAKLETVDCYDVGTFRHSINYRMEDIGLLNLSNVSCNIDIGTNNNMTRLNLPKFNLVHSPYANYSSFTVSVSYNHPDFCITVPEMLKFMVYNDTNFEWMIGDYCRLTNNSELLSQKYCDVRDTPLEVMASDCLKIVGNLLIDEKNQNFVGKLANVDTIFGNLIIRNTNLTDTNFLGSLITIMSMREGEPVILIENNPELRNVTIPKFVKYHAPQTHVPVQMYNNSAELSKTSKFCYDLQNQLTDTMTWIVRINGLVCDYIQRDIDAEIARQTRDNLGSGRSVVFLMGILVLNILF